MESSSSWGSNGLTSVNCGGVWGNSGSTITGGSIWSAGGSAKRSSGEVWSGLEIDSKLEGSKWGSLTSEGSGFRPRNGSPGSNVGASAAPDSDADPWGRSSGHGSSSSWGSASTSDNKDMSGWGSLDPSPVPNAGTESWGFRSGANGSQNENKLNDWKLTGDAKPAIRLEKDLGSNFLLPENSSADVKSSDVQSIWNRCPSVSDSSHDAGKTEANQAESVNKMLLQSTAATTPIISSSSSSTGGARLAEDAPEQEPCLTGDVLSREEIIRLAVNSHEGWGKTPIRQDTAWNIDDEPKKPFLSAKLDEISTERIQRLIREQTNSLSWGQGSDLPSALDKGRTGSGVWGSGVSDNLALGGVSNEVGGSDAGAELDAKVQLASDKMLEPNWPVRPPSGKESEWTSGLGIPQNSWDSSDPTRMNKVGPAETGGRGSSLPRSASASTWSSDESDWPRGEMKDKGGSIWSNDSSNDTQNWKPGFKPMTPLPTESLFNVPPPQFGGSDFDSLVGSLGNTGKQGINMGSGSDSGKPPQMRVRLLQQLMDMGFKREDAQAALISNNLNLESALSKLLAGRMRGSGMDTEADALSARRRFRGANPVDDLSPDVAACLVSLMQNSPNSMSSLGQIGSNLGGSNRPRSSVAGSAPPLPSNPLGMLSPSMLPALQQKLLQPGLRNDGNQTAVQHQLLQQHLLQNVQSAIQANLIPQQLITAQSLTPTVLVKVQQMMEMYQALQGLMTRYQLMVQENLALLQSRQRPQNLSEIELIITTFKQQIFGAQQQILQELTILQPPPLSSASGMDQLLKNFGGLQTKDETLLTAAAGLMNPWKLGPSGDDAAGFLGQMATSNPNLLQHSISGSKADSFGSDRSWMPQSSASCWSRPSELGMIGRSDDPGSSVSSIFSTNSTTDGTMPPVSDGANSSVSEDGSTPGVQLEIAEFIPGKPWQGLSSKSADDDPHMTPGSTTQASLIDASNASGKLGRAYSPSSASVLGGGSDPAAGSSVFSGMLKSSISNANLSQKMSPWSPVDPSITSDLWAKGQCVPPGMSYQNKNPYQQQLQQPQQLQQQQAALNRGNLWSNCEQPSFKPLQSNSPSLPSYWLRLKGVSPQMDMRVLEALCEQHGHVECFVPNVTREGVIIKYAKLDDACKAQKLLSLCPPRVGQPLVAEFLSTYEVFQILQQAPASVHSQIAKPLGGGGGGGAAPAAGPFQMHGLGKSGPNPSRWNVTPSGAQFGAGVGPGGPWGAEEHGLYLPNSKHF